MINKTNKKAFTLLEILLVIAASGILVAVVVSTINPWYHISSFRDNQRLKDVNSLNLAISEYETFVGDSGLSFIPMEICFTDNNTSGRVDCPADLVDLSFLVPDHLEKIPPRSEGFASFGGVRRLYYFYGCWKSSLHKS